MSNDQRDSEENEARLWGRLSSMCAEVHECLYRKRDRDAAKRFLPELQNVLRSLPENDMAIVGAEGLALYHELRGELQTALEHRRREIHLMHRLYKDIEANDYDEETRAYMLSRRDIDALEERNAIVGSLEREVKSESSSTPK